MVVKEGVSKCLKWRIVHKLTSPELLIIAVHYSHTKEFWSIILGVYKKHLGHRF